MSSTRISSRKQAGRCWQRSVTGERLERRRRRTRLNPTPVRRRTESAVCGGRKRFLVNNF